MQHGDPKEDKHDMRVGVCVYMPCLEVIIKFVRVCVWAR